MPGPGWAWREDASREVLVALYVRDALGIVDPGGLPALRGTALPSSDPPPDVVSWWWMRWWVAVIEEHSLATPPVGEDAFDARMKRHLDAARAYAELMADVIRVDLIADAGEPSVLGEELDSLRPHSDRGSLDLRVEVLPLAEPGVWWIGEQALAVDDRLRADREAFRAAIRPLLRQVT